MKDTNVCSRQKRIHSFIIDRIFSFTLVGLLMFYTPYHNLFSDYINYMTNRDFLSSILTSIWIVLGGYTLILLVYFINFVIIQYIFNYTLGKWSSGVQLKIYKNKQLINPSFKDLLKRFFYLYMSGLGGLGYLYIFSKNRKSHYDDSIQMYVLDKKTQ